MKRLFLFTLLSLPAFAAGPISAGIKAGLPMTDFLNTVQGTSSATTNRYIVGPTVSLNLPFGLSFEFDALYRHFSYTDIVGSLGNAVTTTGHAGDWEFPLVAKYKFPGHLIRPYVEAGVAWDTLTGVTTTVSNLSGSVITGQPTRPHDDTTMGAVIGAGLDIHAIVLHISPEVRYTRWTSQHFNVNGVLNSNQNQAEFMVGFTF